MSFLNKIFSKNTNKAVQATEIQARPYFDKLISSYSSDFKIDTSYQILNSYRTISQLNSVIEISAKAFLRAKKNL